MLYPQNVQAARFISTQNGAIAPSLNNFLVANATVFLFRQLKPWRWEICR
ncbi:hypothetical protein [Coleofasciculus sp. G2-EDA-02]